MNPASLPPHLLLLRFPCHRIPGAAEDRAVRGGALGGAGPRAAGGQPPGLGGTLPQNAAGAARLARLHRAEGDD